MEKEVQKDLEKGSSPTRGLKRQVPEETSDNNQGIVVKGEPENIKEPIELSIDIPGGHKKENKIESGEVKFFGSKSNKTLEGELSSNSSAKFKVFNIKGDEAEFEYCGEVINSDWFEGVASFANNPRDVPNKKEIITVKPGIVRKNSEGKWEVQTPVEIKFID